MAKKDIKKCRYILCSHPTKEIDTSSEGYVVVGRKYYHPDCYEEEKKKLEKNRKEQKDIDLFKELWVKCIDKDVSWPMLMKEINSFLIRDYSSGYLLFVLQFCIEQKYKLHYPGGFKYYVDRPEIKKAYGAKLSREIARKNKKNDNFLVREENDFNKEVPKFEPKGRLKGFQSILRR